MPRPERWTKAEWEAANLTLYIRCGGVCWWCAKSLGDEANRHHRQRRRDGGDSLAQTILLHPRCHNLDRGSVHANPTEAVERGFIVPSWAEPLETPIFFANDWWLLDAVGGVVRTSPVAGQT